MKYIYHLFLLFSFTLIMENCNEKAQILYEISIIIQIKGLKLVGERLQRKQTSK